MKFHVLSEAEAEVRAAEEWYEGEVPGLGATFTEAFLAGLAAIRGTPRRFPLIQHGGHRQYRRALLRKFPYQIVYELRGDEVVVLAVAHSRRRPRYWKDRRS